MPRQARVTLCLYILRGEAAVPDPQPQSNGGMLHGQSNAAGQDIPLEVKQDPANPPQQHNHTAPRCRCKHPRLASAAVHQPYRKTRFKQREGNGEESASFVHQSLLCLSNALGYHTNQGVPELG